MTTPSAVVMVPRGWLKSRRIVAGVGGVVVELVGLEDREPVELHEQRAEADDQADAEAADLAGHRASSRWRGVSSEIRRSSASRT